MKSIIDTITDAQFSNAVRKEVLKTIHNRGTARMCTIAASIASIVADGKNPDAPSQFALARSEDRTGEAKTTEDAKLAPYAQSATLRQQLESWSTIVHGCGHMIDEIGREPREPLLRTPAEMYDFLKDTPGSYEPDARMLKRIMRSSGITDPLEVLADLENNSTRRMERMKTHRDAALEEIKTGSVYRHADGEYDFELALMTLGEFEHYGLFVNAVNKLLAPRIVVDGRPQGGGLITRHQRLGFLVPSWRTVLDETQLLMDAGDDFLKGHDRVIAEEATRRTLPEVTKDADRHLAQLLIRAKMSDAQLDEVEDQSVARVLQMRADRKAQQPAAPLQVVPHTAAPAASTTPTDPLTSAIDRALNARIEALVVSRIEAMFGGQQKSA